MSCLFIPYNTFWTGPPAPLLHIKQRQRVQVNISRWPSMPEGVRSDAQGGEIEVHHRAAHPNLVLLQSHATKQEFVRGFANKQSSKYTLHPASLGLSNPPPPSICVWLTGGWAGREGNILIIRREEEGACEKGEVQKLRSSKLPALAPPSRNQRILRLGHAMALSGRGALAHTSTHRGKVKTKSTKAHAIRGLCIDGRG